MISEKDINTLSVLADISQAKSALTFIINNSRGVVDKAKLNECQKKLVKLDRSFVDLFLSLEFAKDSVDQITTAFIVSDNKLNEVKVSSLDGAVLVQPKEEKPAEDFNSEIKIIEAAKIVSDDDESSDDPTVRPKIKSSRGKASKK